MKVTARMLTDARRMIAGGASRRQVAKALDMRETTLAYHLLAPDKKAKRIKAVNKRRTERRAEAALPSSQCPARWTDEMRAEGVALWRRGFSQR